MSIHPCYLSTYCNCYTVLNINLLDRFRGPAPIPHTILAQVPTTGVTLQTLDDKNFDRGIILAQTTLPGYPISDDCTSVDLLQFITPKAAKLLVRGIADELYMPPLVAKSPSLARSHDQEIPRAPKITPEDKEIKWKRGKVFTQFRALGRLWSNCFIDANTTKRIIFESFTPVHYHASFPDWITMQKVKVDSEDMPVVKILDSEDRSEEEVSAQLDPVLRHTETENRQAVHFILVSSGESQQEKMALYYIDEGNSVILSAGGQLLRVDEITIEGRSKQPASKAMQSLSNSGRWSTKKRLGQNGEPNATGLPLGVFHWRSPSVLIMSQHFLNESNKFWPRHY